LILSCPLRAEPLVARFFPNSVEVVDPSADQLMEVALEHVELSSIQATRDPLCRRGELLALQWSDFDLETGSLDISKSLEQTRAGLRVKSTKSEKPRRVALPEWALEVLKQHRAEQANDRTLFGRDYADNDLIFCQPSGQYYSPDRVGARVAELMRKTGLQGVSLHSLRHSHASILLSEGVPISVVSERLGHADHNITLSIYSHALPADSRAAAKIWNDSMAVVISSASAVVEPQKKTPARLPGRVF
jgi:integrase